MFRLINLSEIINNDLSWGNKDHRHRKPYDSNFFAIVNPTQDGIYDGIAYCCHWFPWLEKFTSCWVKYLWLEMVWFPAHEQTQRNNIFSQNYFHNLVSRWTLLSCIRFCYMLSKFMIQILWIHINILYHRKTFFISCKKKFGCIFVVTRKE